MPYIIRTTVKAHKNYDNSKYSASKTISLISTKNISAFYFQIKEQQQQQKYCPYPRELHPLSNK